VLLRLNTTQQLILEFWFPFPFLLENGDEAYGGRIIILNSVNINIDQSKKVVKSISSVGQFYKFKY